MGLCLDLVIHVPLVFFLFFADNQLFPCLSQVLLVNVIDQAGTFHATGVKIRLAVYPQELIEGFGS